jgi:hypothetical protein
MGTMGDRIWRTVVAIQLKLGTRVEVDQLNDCDEFRFDTFIDGDTARRRPCGRKACGR